MLVCWPQYRYFFWQFAIFVCFVVHWTRIFNRQRSVTVFCNFDCYIPCKFVNHGKWIFLIYLPKNFPRKRNIPLIFLWITWNQSGSVRETAQFDCQNRTSLTFWFSAFCFKSFIHHSKHFILISQSSETFVVV